MNENNFPLLTTTTNLSYVDSFTSSTNKIYINKIRAFHEEDNILGCSDFTREFSVKIVDAPKKFRALIISIDNIQKEVKVRLSRENTFPKTNYHLERCFGATTNFEKVVILVGGPSINDSISYEDILDLSSKGTYSYKVYADFGWATTSPAFAEISVNITPIKGWAWLGDLGWVRLSNDSFDSSWGKTENLSVDNVNYGVFLDNDTKKFFGYAWAPFLGWLSFEESDLVNCPRSPCEAWVESDGLVKGWAVFLSQKGNGRIEKNFVSLSKKPNEQSDYGLYFTTTTENNFVVGGLRGYAWLGSENFGTWLSFGGPVLEKVVVKAITGATASIDVYWKNLRDYNRVEIWLQKEGEEEWAEKGFSKENNDNEVNKGVHKATIQVKLLPNTSYKVWVKGWY